LQGTGQKDQRKPGIGLPGSSLAGRQREKRPYLVVYHVRHTTSVVGIHITLRVDIAVDFADRYPQVSFHIVIA
jgi:hypothetical protein